MQTGEQADRCSLISPKTPWPAKTRPSTDSFNSNRIAIDSRMLSTWTNIRSTTTTLSLLTAVGQGMHCATLTDMKVMATFTLNATAHARSRGAGGRPAETTPAPGPRLRVLGGCWLSPSFRVVGALSIPPLTIGCTSDMVYETRRYTSTFLRLLVMEAVRYVAGVTCKARYCEFAEVVFLGCLVDRCCCLGIGRRHEKTFLLCRLRMTPYSYHYQLHDTWYSILQVPGSKNKWQTYIILRTLITCTMLT